MTHAHHLTCRELVELAGDYVDATLAPDVVARLEEHLDDCEGCRNYVDQLRRTIGLLAAFGDRLL